MEDSEKPDSSRKIEKSSLKSILEKARQKTAVQTSNATLYVSPIAGRDFDWIEKAAAECSDDESLGKFVLRRLVTRSADTADQEPLADLDFAALSVSELRNFAEAISSRNDGGSIDDSSPVAALGRLVRVLIERNRAALQAQSEQMKAVLKNAFPTIASSTLDILKSQMGEMDKTTRLLKSMSSPFAGLDPSKILTSIGRTDHLQLRQPMDDFAHNHLPRASQIVGPSPLLVRAAEAAEQTASHIESLTTPLIERAIQIGELAKTLTTSVLPEWQKQSVAARQDSDLARASAERSIRVAMWIAIATAGISVVLAGAQYVLSQIDKRESDAQQVEVMKTQKEQLRALEKLQAQMAENARLLREQLQAQTALVRQNTVQSAKK